LCHLPKFKDPNLIVGFEDSDDAAVYLVDENVALVQTVDLITPMVDNPYQFGQIAAANSLSDIYAMGGSPKLALNILCCPEDMPMETVQGILQGGYEKVQEAEAIIAGGHTIKDQEPKYGLSVTGFISPDRVLTNSNAKIGDIIILTKPLGTGILNTAAKAKLITQATVDATIASMVMLNKRAYQLMIKHSIHSCTDITGFGLFGHAYEMSVGSGVTIFLDSNAMPLLPEVRDMARMGIIPVGAYANRDYLKSKIRIDSTTPLDLLDILFDPQTSGGLLIAVSEKEAYTLLSELKGEIPCAEIIGQVLPFDTHSIHIK